MSGFGDGTAEFDDLDSEDELTEDPEEDGVMQVQGVDPEEAKIFPVPPIRRSFEDLHM